MRSLWTTDRGADPALRQRFAADRPAALATAVIGGAAVLATLVDEHEDFDCPLGDLHHQRCPEHGLRIWDRSTGRLIREVRGVCDNGTGYPAVLATVTVEGRAYAVIRDWARPPKLIDLESGRRVGDLPGHDAATEVQDLAVVDGPDGPVVVTVGWDGVLRITTLATGRAMAVETGTHLNCVAVVSFAGQWMAAAAGRGAVTLWNLADAISAGTLPLAEDHVPTVMVNWLGDDPTVALLDTKGRIGVLNLGTGGHRPLSLPPALTPNDIAAVINPDGRRLLAVADDEAISVWDVEADAPLREPLTGPVRYARVLADGPGTVIAGSPHDDAISVWDLDGGRPSGVDRVESDIHSLVVAPDGFITAGGADDRVRRWRPDGGAAPDLDRIPGGVGALAVMNGYLLAAGVAGGALHRWVDGRPLAPVMLGHRGPVDAVIACVVDGIPVVLSAGGDGRIQLTEVETGVLLGTIEHRYPPRGVAAGRLDGRAALAVSWMFGPFALFDVATRAEIATPAAANVQVGEAARGGIDTRTGPAVVTVRESLVQAHNLVTGAVFALQPGTDEPVTALAAGDSMVAIARTDCTVTIVDSATGNLIDCVRLPYPATALAWAPEGTLVVACRRDIHCFQAVPPDAV